MLEATKIGSVAFHHLTKPNGDQIYIGSHPKPQINFKAIEIDLGHHLEH